MTQLTFGWFDGTQAGESADDCANEAGNLCNPLAAVDPAIESSLAQAVELSGQDPLADPHPSIALGREPGNQPLADQHQWELRIYDSQDEVVWAWAPPPGPTPDSTPGGGK